MKIKCSFLDLFNRHDQFSGKYQSQRRFKWEIICTSSHRRCSVKEGVLRNFAKFIGKNLYQRLFFNKVAGVGLQLY